MHPLLLQIAPILQAVNGAGPTNPDVRFFEWAIRLAPIAVSLYVLFSGRSLESRKVQDKQMADLLLAKETQQERMKGMQLEFERAMDEMLRRHQDHENKLSEVGRIREEMAGMRAELKYVVEGYKEISTKLDRLLERNSK